MKYRFKENVSNGKQHQKLKKLYDDGVLTKEEYEAQKKKPSEKKLNKIGFALIEKFAGKTLCLL